MSINDLCFNTLGRVQKVVLKAWLGLQPDTHLNMSVLDFEIDPEASGFMQSSYESIKFHCFLNHF